MTVSELVQFLAGVDGFSALGPDELERLAERVVVREYTTGEHILRRGDVGDALHVIVSGDVRVPVTAPGGREMSVVRLGAGDLVGEMALLTGEPRNADVIAEGPVVAISIDRAVVEPILRAHPPLARLLTEILGRRLEGGGGIEWVGKYRLIGKIGSGGTSRVYRGVHGVLNRVVGIKMLSHSLAYDERFRDRFLQEARIIAELVHPNVVQVFDMESRYATFFIIMELIEGTDLASRLRKHGPLPVAEVLLVLRQLSSALAYAHGQGIVHRDVKPANCALDQTGTVKLMDFGIARHVAVGSTEVSKYVEGTPYYVAPEAAMGRVVDGRADIYSLGVVAYELCTGRVPYDGETLQEVLAKHVKAPIPDVTALRSDLPEGLVSFIQGALAKSPDSRLSDFRRIASLLDVEGASPYEIVPRRTEVLTIRYPASASSTVQSAIGGLAHVLGSLEGVEIARAELAPLVAGNAIPN